MPGCRKCRHQHSLRVGSNYLCSAVYADVRHSDDSSGETARKIRNRIDEHKADFTRCTEARKAKEQDVAKIQGKRAEINAELRTFSTSMDSIEDLKAELDGAKAALQHAKDEETRPNFPMQVETFTTQLDDTRKKISELDELQRKITTQVRETMIRRLPHTCWPRCSIHTYN